MKQDMGCILLLVKGILGHIQKNNKMINLGKDSISFIVGSISMSNWKAKI